MLPKRPGTRKVADKDRLWTLGGISERTGVPIRPLRHWADAGALRATEDTAHSGTGVHRRFLPVEVEIAALLAPFEGFGGMTIGRALRLGATFRQALAGSSAQPAPVQFEVPGQLNVALARARAGVGVNWLAVISSPAISVPEPLKGMSPYRRGRPKEPHPALYVVTDAGASAPNFDPSTWPVDIDTRALVHLINLNARLARLLE